MHEEDTSAPREIPPNVTNQSDVGHTVSEDSEEIAKARARLAWRESTEYARVRRLERGLLYSIVPFAGIGAFSGWVYATTSTSESIYSNESQYILLGALIGAATFMYFAFFLRNISRSRARREFSDRMLLGQAQAELRQVEDEITGGDTDFGTLWAATQKRLDYYHKIATTQAERSFMYGQIAAGAGFVVIIIAAFVAGFSRSTAAAIASGVTGVAGGGLGAYIGSTFMKSQDMASAQLRAYFSQPLEFSKYLAAERLLTFIDKSDRTAAVNDMISSIMSMPSNQSSDKT
jgi:hypothetical protein